jgi:hypothetical protein
MGVELYLDVDFTKVGQEQWESVYDETVKLIGKYPFMDKVVDKERYSETLVYAERTKERYLKPWFPETLGWHTIGDMKTLEKAGSFYLLKDSKLYNTYTKDGKTGDIYFSWFGKVHTDNKELNAVRTNSDQVFRSKTQGVSYHKYLLGIAALIEDRLKPHAMVSGDITFAQLQASVDWVNKHLERKISLPDRCYYTKLCSRLEKDLKSETAILDGLFSLLLYPQNKELGDFIRDRFSRKTIVAYWRMDVKGYNLHSHGGSWWIKDYLDMHFSLEDLCEILVVKNNDKYMTPKECIRSVLETGILDEENKENWFSVNNQTDPVPDTVPALFSKAFFRMAGCRDSTSFSMDEQALKNLFYSVFKQKGVVDEAFAEYKKDIETESPAASLETLLKSFTAYKSRGEGDDTTQQWDITEPEEIIYWKDGDSLHPNLEKNVQKLFEAVDSSIRELKRKFAGSSENERIEILLRNNRFILINKKTWDFVLENIHDDTIFYQFLSLLCIKPGWEPESTILDSVLNNLEFLKYRLFCRPVSANP